MDVYVMDTSFNILGLFDQFKSFIWTERFNSPGDFELVLPITKDAVELLKRGNYLSIVDSEYLMVIEGISMDAGQEDGYFMTVTGRDAAVLLERRIMIDHQQFDNANFQDAFLNLITSNAISPANSKRAIPNLQLVRSTESAVTSVTFSASYWGDNLLLRTHELCQANDIGYRMLYHEGSGFTFGFYGGVNRSYSQSTNPYVIFSSDFDNLIKSQYAENEESYRTAALVVGAREVIQKEETDPETEEKTITEYEGATMYTYVGDDGPSGLDRREMLLDATGISAKTEPKTEKEEAKPIPKAQYLDILKSRGELTLGQTKVVVAYDGEIDAQWQFVYGQDFFLGDIVQVRNDFGLETEARVTEVVRSWDESGERVLPTFTKKEE